MSELPLDAYYDLTQVTELAVAPDGDRVAFVADEFDPDADERVSSLFVVPRDGSRDPHRLTRVADAAAPSWAPAGDRLAFLAAREEDAGRRVGREEAADGDADDEAAAGNGDGAADGDEPDEEEPERQVWLFDLALGGDARQVTDLEEGVREFDWSPDGDRLVVSARDPTDAEQEYLEGRRRDNAPVETERLQHKLDGVGYTDDVTTYLFVVDVETGESERLDEAYGGGSMEGLSGMVPAWGAGGRVAFTSCRLSNPDDTYVRDVYTIAPDGSALRKLTDSTLSVDTVEWGPDGERLAFVAGDPENWCVPSQVYLGDGDDYESLTADLDRTVARGGALHWDGEAVYTRIADEARTRLVRVATDGTVERVFEAQGEDRALAGFDLAADAGTAGLVLSHPGDGKDVYAVDAADLDAAEPPASLTRLSELNAALTEAYEMPEVTRVGWESEGWDISGVLYHPPDFDPADPEARPMVLAIHGGPISYDEPVFDFNHAVFTSRGYVVLRPNYRGGSSYGRAFAEQLRGVWGTHEVTDIAAGVEYAVDRGWADPDRVFGHGFSYGGIAQGYLVTQTDVLTAAAPEHGIYDLRSAFGTDDSHVWVANDYGLPWENAEAYDASSAITDAGNIDTPLLVTAGEVDWRCPPSQSEQLYVAARKQGVDARFVLYPEEHHNVGDPDRALHRLRELTAWYRRHDPAVEDGSVADPHGRADDGDAED